MLSSALMLDDFGSGDAKIGVLFETSLEIWLFVLGLLLPKNNRHLKNTNLPHMIPPGTSSAQASFNM